MTGKDIKLHWIMELEFPDAFTVREACNFVLLGQKLGLLEEQLRDMVEAKFLPGWKPKAPACRHCGSTDAVLVRHPHNMKFSCVPCLRKEEPKFYRALARSVKEMSTEEE